MQRRLDAIPRPLATALLFAGAALVSGVTILQGIQPNDEGLMLQAVARISDGQVPYRDFWWFYPHGQPYLLAGLWKLFGPSLLVWRIVRVLVDATVTVLAYRLARRHAPRPAALAAALASALAMAYPTGPHPFPIALALALGALLCFERSPLAAGALAGACAAWRIEFAAYLGLGVLLAYAVRPGPGRERGLLALRFAGAATLVVATLYLPVVAAAGLSDSWELLVRYPVRDFSHYQHLPFPIHYRGSVGSLGSLEDALAFYLPLALLIGLAGSLLGLATSAVRARERAWPLVAAAIFGIGMANYLLVRTDLFHTAPLAVAGSVLAAWALAGLRGPAARSRAITLVPAVAAALGLGYAILEGADRRKLSLAEDNAALRLPVADGVRAAADDRGDIERAVAFVRSRTRTGEPIYVATRRSDIVTSGNPLFYVLADRPNPTHYDIQAPGVITSAPVQREIIGDLQRARTRVVIRFTDPVTASPEPNRAGRSSGVRLLDDFIARTYRPARRFGAYLALTERTGESAVSRRRRAR